MTLHDDAMSKFFDNAIDLLITLTNAVLFAVMTALFVMVFWYPQVLGRIFGSMVKGFYDVFLY